MNFVHCDPANVNVFEPAPVASRSLFKIDKVLQIIRKILPERIPSVESNFLIARRLNPVEKLKPAHPAAFSISSLIIHTWSPRRPHDQPQHRGNQRRGDE